MNAEQALKILTRLQAAAPPPTAARIAEVAVYLEGLERDKNFLEALHGQGLPDLETLEAADALAEMPPAPQPELAADMELTERDDGSITLTETEEILMQIDWAIRAPLETVRKQISNVLSGSIGRFSSDQYGVFEDIAGNNDSALRLLDNVTQMIAVRHGLLEVDTLVFSCPLLVREASDVAEPWLKARKQRITPHLPDAVLQAEGDYQRVLTILTDLIDNASRYSPAGSAIQVSVEDLGSHVLFSVADMGVGLSPEDMAHVGEPFWRAQNQELVREQPGTGLRLFLARSLLALQGGELIFSGEEGVGSTFSFTLPAANAG